ncbi:substrate-binding domain-containing protein [Micromonospora sp. DR5-3]|uniref:substrate-binding domain-containing protein n=1 Tax=unclassified Micromonospora TaxID=2617518 RepID=UPI0011D5EBF2|nr:MULTISPECIES: substrate-binding domain-containing protein [unclassified Micromonospora]MCW3814308.1 substrate-binding domain-containing protein [Micromonospora sp. DR5-3]TYC23343.1 ABC transporter substrate-binding protein [Micromonospora sp. MP36]
MTKRWALVVAAGVLALAGCSSDLPDDQASAGGSPSSDATKSKFFDQTEYDRQLKFRSATPQGPDGKPWEQMLEPEMVDTAKFAKPGGKYTLCFSNAAVNNPWRQVGFKTMQQEVKLHPEITTFTVLDAEAKDDKQISDIQSLSGKNCSAIIISPNTTATLTPAVEQACQTGVPVIVFDRGVNTSCPVTFIHPIGGFAFGADGAEFLKEKVKPGGKVLALRILPGVDVLEQRWAAANEIFTGSELKVVGVEFTDGDAAKTKSIVADYIQREGRIDGVWMDAGATAVAAAEAFQDAGVDVPAIVGEDQQDFLRLWVDENLTAVAPTYPTYQWRTPIIAALKILKGEQVPKEWVLPQPRITDDKVKDYVKQDMPPLHYAMCGCEGMPGYPVPWK